MIFNDAIIRFSLSLRIYDIWWQFASTFASTTFLVAYMDTWSRNDPTTPTGTWFATHMAITCVFITQSIRLKNFTCERDNLEISNIWIISFVISDAFLRSAMNCGTRITGWLRQPTTSLHTWPITRDIKACLCLFIRHSPKHPPGW